MEPYDHDADAVGDSPAARLIALDWGTSSLRAYLLGEGACVLDEADAPWGIMATPDGDFAKALRTVTGVWTARHPDLPMIAAGMIGSAQGWREIPYVACPAGVDDVVAAVRAQCTTNAGVLPIIPGLFADGVVPGVMRGEETQLFGAMALQPGLAEAATVILPGTHSKWVTVRDGRIEGFSTYMTGELFGALKSHTILGRPAMEAQKQGKAPSGTAWEAFDRGVAAIQAAPSTGLTPLLFSARSLVLAHRLAPEASLDYLSGLLLGEELRCALSACEGCREAPLALIGEAGLCRRYLRALALFGVTDVPVIEGAAAAGLWRIAELA